MIENSILLTPAKTSCDVTNIPPIEIALGLMLLINNNNSNF